MTQRTHTHHAFYATPLYHQLSFSRSCAQAFIFARSIVPGAEAVRAPLSSVLLGAVVFLLGFASYGWWGSRRYFCWRSDHALMEAHVLLLMLIFCTIGTGGAVAVGGETRLVSVCVAAWWVRAATMGKARLLLCAGLFVFFIYLPLCCHSFFAGFFCSTIQSDCASTSKSIRSLHCMLISGYYGSFANLPPVSCALEDPFWGSRLQCRQLVDKEKCICW